MPVTDYEETKETQNILEELLDDLKLSDGKLDVSCNDGNVQAQITGSEKTLHLIVEKRSPSCEKYMYTKVIPEFLRIQDDFRVLHPFAGFAKWYQSTKTGDLLIDDLQRNDFVHAKHLDYEHVKMGIEEFGKLHAMSFGLRTQNSSRFEDLASGMQNNNTDFINTLEKSSTMLEERLQDKVYNPKGKLQVFQKFVSNLDISDKCVVFVQGGGSMTNLLFKYQKHSQVPIEVCFPDWKMARLGSPAFDLSYFLFTSTDREFRRNHYDYLLQVYYGSLCTYLHLLGISNPNKLMTYSELCNHMKKYSVYVLYMIYYAMGNDKSKDKEFNDETITDIIRDFIQFDYL